MNIRILGTRGEIPVSAPRHRLHSGLLVDRRIMLDLGEQSFIRCKPRAIFITHLHPDHAAFVREMFEIKHIPVFAPERSRYAFLQLARPSIIDTYRITPIPTEHSVKVKSSAYLIEHGGRRMLYTGDIVWMQKKYRDRLGMLDCVITEASFLKEGGMIRKDKRGKLFGHAGIPNIIRMFEPHTRKIILTHFGSWFFKDIEKARAGIDELSRKYGIKIIVGYDGMIVTL